MRAIGFEMADGLARAFARIVGRRILLAVISAMLVGRRIMRSDGRGPVQTGTIMRGEERGPERHSSLRGVEGISYSALNSEVHSRRRYLRSSSVRYTFSLVSN